MLSESKAELGGYKEVIMKVAGDRVYGRLKFESGAHRVQRVPATESQGRIHTSACTVAVMAEADPMTETTIDTKDLRIDTFEQVEPVVSTSIKLTPRFVSLIFRRVLC